MQKRMDVNVTRVKHLRNPFAHRWKSAADIATATSVRSVKVIGRIFSVILRIFKETALKWDPDIEAALPRSQCPFPNILISFQDFISFNLMEKSSVYGLYVITLFPSKPAEPQARWRALLQADRSETIKWHVMYNEPIVKRSGDLQWRVAHNISPCNVSSHRMCPVCDTPETGFHSFVECSRLTPFLKILSRIIQGLGLFFMHCLYIRF